MSAEKPTAAARRAAEEIHETIRLDAANLNIAEEIIDRAFAPLLAACEALLETSPDLPVKYRALRFALRAELRKVQGTEKEKP